MRLGRPGAMVDSFLGVLDIKLEIILLFGLINKVAGVYGLITVFVGGSFAQLAFYAYSVATLFAFLWALRVVKSESATPATTVAHLYALDHVIQAALHYLFYRNYWYLVPHDGRRNANSQAQQDLINLAVSRGEIPDPSSQDSPGSDELRKALAGEIWDQERVFAVWIIVAGFLLKVYFTILLYSYAAHLRSSSYHTLPLTARAKAAQPAPPTATGPESVRLVSRGQGSSFARSAASPVRKENAVGKEMERLQKEEDEFTWDE